MAGRTGSLHRAVVHFFRRKCRLAAVAQRTFVSRHAGRTGRRNVIRRFAQHPGIGTRMTGLAGTRGDPGVSIGQLHWRPERGVVADLAVGCRGHVIRQFDIDIGVGRTVAVSASGGHNMGIRRDQWHPGNTCSMADIALLCRRNMDDRLPGRRSAVMAGRASIDNAGM